MTPTKIHISNEVLNRVATDWECADIYIAPVQDILKTEVTTPYILETEHQKLIAEKDAEIERLKQLAVDIITIHRGTNNETF